MGDDQGEILSVEVDAIVVMQIMKHCRQQAPTPVTGQLLGLDVGNTMQITHCFGSAKRDDTSQEEGEEYQIDMQKLLRDVNVDSNVVGWYQTTHLGQFFNDTVIDMQYQYQTQIARSVLLVYDPLQAAVGKPALKATQLTQEFITKLYQQDMSSMGLDEFSSNLMFTEIPIVIRSSVMVDAFLAEWAIQDPIGTMSQLENLDLENQAFAEKNVDLMIRSLQDLYDEQDKILKYEKQAGRNDKVEKGKGKGRYGQMQKPRQLDTMILSQQIQNYCRQVNNFAGDTLGKVFLLSNKPAGS